MNRFKDLCITCFAFFLIAVPWLVLGPDTFFEKVCAFILSWAWLAFLIMWAWSRLKSQDKRCKPPGIKFEGQPGDFLPAHDDYPLRRDPTQDDYLPR